MDTDPNLIALIVPIGKYPIKAFRLPHNQKWLLNSEPSERLDYRGATPVEGVDEYPANDPLPDNYKQIRLGFDNLPPDGLKFGTDDGSHIRLGENGNHIVSGISGTHFRITYNERHHLVLKDSSTNGTVVAYGGEGENEARKNFTWILNLPRSGKGREQEVEVFVPQGKLMRFKILLATHRQCMTEYKQNLKKFLAKSRGHLDMFDILAIKSCPITEQPTQAHTPKTGTIYIKLKTIGCGTFGEVVLMADVSTAATYARKRMRVNDKRDDEERRKADEMFRGEIDIMKKLDNKYIAPLLASSTDHYLDIWMPYYPLGNLDDENAKSPFTFDDIRELSHQALMALECMHKLGVIHRDLKPLNILVERRDPLHIRLADFGASKQGTTFETQIGTTAFMAPEICYSDQKKYTRAADIWSMGVMIMRFVHGLPDGAPNFNARSISAWCENVCAHMNTWQPSLFKDLVKQMLVMEPKERSSATQCLRIGECLGLFSCQESEPTPQTEDLSEYETQNSYTAEWEDSGPGSVYEDHGSTGALTVRYNPRVGEQSETMIPNIEKPKTMIPNIEKPETMIPSIEKPETMIPNIEKPEAMIPNIEKPETMIPNIKKPEAMIPNIEKPETMIPSIEDPDIIMRTAPPFTPLCWPDRSRSAAYQIMIDRRPAGKQPETIIPSIEDPDTIMRTAPPLTPSCGRRLAKEHRNAALAQPAPAAKTCASSHKAATVDRGTGRAERSATVENSTQIAVDRALSNHATEYFQLPYRDGKLKIRKNDHRVNISQALDLAGISADRARSLRSQRSPNRVSKIKRHDKFVTLKAAIGIARKHGLPELVLLLAAFLDIYQSITSGRRAKAVLLESEKDDKRCDADYDENHAYSQRLQVEPDMDSRSGSATPMANSPRAVSPNNYNDPSTESGIKIIVDGAPAEDNHGYTFTDGLYENESVAKETPNFEREPAGLDSAPSA